MVTGVVLACAASRASAQQTAPDAPRPTPHTHLLLVTGLSGDPAFAQRFHEWGERMVRAATARHGLAAGDVTWLAEDPARAPGRIASRSTKEAIGGTLAALAARVGPRGRLVLLFIGHGTTGESRLALPGPDLSAAELARMLAPFDGREVAVVLASSASGDFVPALSGPGRVVITATKSGMEGNETRFAAHFVDAHAKDGADADKDGRVSLLEAFAYATAEVKREYDDGGRLLTEHALLDDDGDRQGSQQPGRSAGDGRLARAFALASARVAAAAPASAEGAALDERKRDVERRLDLLRARKAQMSAAAYDEALEQLLVELAEVTKRLRAQGGTP